MLSADSWSPTSKLTGSSHSALLAACGLLRDTRKDGRTQPGPLPPAPVVAAPPLQARQGFPTAQSFDETVGSTASSSSTAARLPWSDKISRRTSLSSSSSSSAGSLQEAGLDAGLSTRPARPPRPPRKAPWPGPTVALTSPQRKEEAVETEASTGPSGLEARDPHAAFTAPQRTVTTDSPRVFEEIVGTSPEPRSRAVRSIDFAGSTGQVSASNDLDIPASLRWASWSASPNASVTSPKRQSGSRGSGVVQALSHIIEDLVSVKYGIALDSTDLNRKISSHCQGSRSGETGGSGVLSPVDVVQEFNLRSSDLRFRVLGSDGSAALHLETRMTSSFQELQAEVRRMPGSARTLAVVVPLSLDLRSVADEEGQARAVAVFREDYGRPNLLVGRDVEPGAKAPLNSFSSANLQCAIVIDPVIDKVLRNDDSREVAAPSLRDEYASLGIMLLPEEIGRTSPSKAEVAHIAVKPWQQILDAALIEDGGPAPTQRWMWRMRRVLEHPDASPETLLHLLTQVVSWLQGGGNVAIDAQFAVLSAGLPPGLVLLIQRFLLEHTEPKSPTRRVELSITMQVCRIIALSCRGLPDCAAAFTQSHAISTLCSLMQRWPENGDVQLGAIHAIDALIEEDSHAAAKAVSSGAVNWIRVAVKLHPRPEIQRYGAHALQHLSVVTTEMAAGKEDTAIEKSHDEDVASRKGLAEALMEKRAADAFAKPGIVSTAVGWLFSGRQRGNASTRQGNSEPAGRRSVNQKGVPAPCVPPTLAPAVPRLELSSLPRMGTSPTTESWRENAITSGATATKAVGDGRRATSRPAPMVATEAHDDGMSPREDSPMTPSAVLFMHRREKQEPHETDLIPEIIQASGQRH